VCTVSQHSLLQSRCHSAEQELEQLRANQNVQTLQDTISKLEKKLQLSSEKNANFLAKIASLEQNLMDLQNKYDALRRKHMGGGGPGMFSKLAGNKNAVRQEKKLQEEIADLKFQLYYGDGKQDKEVAMLKKRLEAVQLENAQGLKDELRSVKLKAVEDWLLCGDLAESLYAASG